MTARRRRKRRTQVNRRIAPVLAALVLIVLIAAAVFISYLIDQIQPFQRADGVDGILFHGGWGRGGGDPGQ